jgi:hypothetical protein
LDLLILRIFRRQYVLETWVSIKTFAVGPRRFYKRRADAVFALYIDAVHPWSFPATSGASGVKNWRPPRTDREKGSEQERGRGKEWEGKKPVSLEISPPRS